MITHQRVLFTFACLFSAAIASAQPTTQGVAPKLGARFESLSAGVALTPPADCTIVRGSLGSTEVVRFTNDQKKWILKVSRVILETSKPLPLTEWKDKDGKGYPGMLELTAEQFKTDVPGAQIFREDVTEINHAQVGMLAAKYSYGMETNLSQQAIVRDSDLQYYIVAMTSPAPRTVNIENDPGVLDAVHTFDAVLNSVQVIDQTAAREDRDARLLRTRSLYLNMTAAKITPMLGNQWLRIMRDGKDIGYSYVVEEVARDLPRKGKADESNGPEGVLVGIRSRVLPDSGGQVDSESWYFSTFDRKYEGFSVQDYADSPTAGKAISGELGVSRWRERPVPVAVQGIGAHNQVVLTDEYKLEVTKIGRNVGNEPIARDLPPYYLPQAMGHLLPRLITKGEPQTYLFAVWVPEAAQVMYRFVDVDRAQEITLAGHKVQAVPIRDRIGLEGSITTHYVSLDGAYLGSVTPDTKTTILATDAATLERLWRNANLSRPGAVDRR